MDSMADRDNLIKLYYCLGMSYRNIVEVIAVQHGFIISLRHLARRLRIMGIGRRRYCDVADVLLFIHNELEGSGQLHGYRWMYQKCLDHNLCVRKEDVRLILDTLCPNSTLARRRHRLHRRMYYAGGPNFIWHIDSYDKIKPFGFCINGCIDGFSRKIIWLEVSNNSSNPKLIGGYYVSAVSKLNGCPKLLRGDLGTENSYVRDFQRLLRGNRQNRFNVGSYLQGASTHNQRIECWWGHLRKQCMEFWINLFQTLRNSGDFDGDFLDKNILQFCFMGMIQVCATFFISTLKGLDKIASPVFCHFKMYKLA